MTTLNLRGYGIPKATLSTTEIDELKQELTVSPAGNPLMPTSAVPSFPLYMESSKKLYVPKYFGLSKFGAPDADKLSDGRDIDVPFTGSLRPEQMKPVDAFLCAANDPLRRGGILSLPCGSGKTVIALHIIARMRKKTVIVVHKDFLLTQWKERIEQFMPTASVGLIKAKHCDVKDRDIVIASLQSLSMKEYSDDVFQDVGMLVIDEVHRTGTEVFSRALQKFNFRYSLGLSATVKRKDGLTKVFVWFIGDVVFKVSRRKDTSLNVVMREFFVKDPAYCSEHFINGKALNLARMVNNVCEYEPRTRMMVSVLRDVFDRSGGTRRFLVLSDRKSLLNRIHALLQEENDGRRHMTSGFYIGGMKPSALEESLSKHVILATFSFASEGFDAQHLDTLLLASPKTDIEQSVGRILRVHAGGERVNAPLVIDIVDGFSMFDRQANKRRAFYKRHGYSVHSQSFDCDGSVLDAVHHAIADDDDDDDGGIKLPECAFKDIPTGPE